MTVSTTPCCARLPERLFGLLLILLLLFTAPLVRAAEAQLRHAEVVLGEEGYVLNAEFELELNQRLVEAVSRGVSLYFTAELTLERPRWYWFDQVVSERTLNYRLSYHAITRSYRLSVGNFHHSFDTLEAALRTMSRIRNWQVAAPGALRSGEPYNVALRFRLDTGQLPKPFQVTAIGSRDWQLSTDWQRWTYLPAAPDAR
jgi:hypothetical protein